MRRWIALLFILSACHEKAQPVAPEPVDAGPDVVDDEFGHGIAAGTRAGALPSGWPSALDAQAGRRQENIPEWRI